MSATATLRADRRRRLLDAMAEHDLDALILGRSADVAFASGARQLWTAGARPFGPAAVVVRETGRVHVLSVFDEGMPPEVGHDDLYGLSWNPANLMASLATIPGLRRSHRVGTGSTGPGFEALVNALAPEAEMVDGAAAIWAARTRKSAEEIALIEDATAVAESALAAMIDALEPGVTERQLVAVYLGRLGSLGAPTPPTEGVACAMGAGGPGLRPRLRRIAGDRPIDAGELVALDSGAFSSGYEGRVGRTWLVGRAPATAAQRELAFRCRAALDSLVRGCRAGATGTDLCRRWSDTGEPFPGEPLVHGVGLGVEPPIIGERIGADAVLQAGMVLSVSAWVAEPGVGGFFERETIAVTDNEPNTLSRYRRGPAAEGA